MGSVCTSVIVDPIQVSKATQQPDSAHKPVESTSFLVPWPKPASYSRTKDEPLKGGYLYALCSRNVPPMSCQQDH